MGYARKMLEKLSDNRIARHAVLIICAIIIFLSAAYMLLNIFTRHNKYKTVPDFVGTAMNEALQTARRQNLRIEINDSLFVPVYEGGVILDQHPAAGSQVKSGRRIFVTVNSYRQKKVKVPYVTGYSLRQAKSILEVAGLEIKELQYVDDIATNYVLDEKFDGKAIHSGSGLEVEIGSGITLVVGRGEDASDVEIPKLIGLTLADAKSRLWDRGLNIGKIGFEDGINLLNRKNARIVTQSPAYGSAAALGSSISVTLSLDGERIDKSSQSADKQAGKLIRQREQEQQQADSEDKTVQAIIDALENEQPSEFFD